MHPGCLANTLNPYPSNQRSVGLKGPKGTCLPASLHVTAMGRSRYEGTPEELCETLLPVASHKSFVKYDETEDVRKTKVAEDMEATIELHSALLAALHHVQPNLAFPKLCLQKALALVCDKKAAEWDLLEKHRDDWERTMYLRLKNLLRVISQGDIKRPKWASKLPWLQAGASGTSVAQATDDAAADMEPMEYFYDFDQELMQAIRAPVGNLEATEPSQHLEEPPEAQPSDPMVAVWPDGHRRRPSQTRYACTDMRYHSPLGYETS